MTAGILVNIGSGNGLLLIQHPEITWSNADLLTSGFKYIQWNIKKNTKLFIQKHAFCLQSGGQFFQAECV